MATPTQKALVCGALGAALAAAVAMPSLLRAPAGPVPTALPDLPAQRMTLSTLATDGLRTLGYAAKTSAGVAAQAPSTASGSSAALAATLAARKLIRTAQLTVEVSRYERAAEEVGRVAESFGGYLAEAQATRGQQDRQAGTLTIRVPADRFASVLAALKGLGKVKAENVSTQDVTKAYADLETRLKVKRETADRLRELLGARTAKLSEVLEAERELARVTEEIEQMEGERRFYDAQVALSTITLSLHEPQALVEPGVFAPIGDALRGAAEVLSRSVAGLVFLVALLTPWLLVAFVVWRTVKAVRGRRKAAARGAEA